MTSKGLVTVGPRHAALKPDTIDCHAASCLPSPSCLPHSTPARQGHGLRSAAGTSSTGMPGVHTKRQCSYKTVEDCRA